MREKTNEDWLAEIEDVIESLRDQRGELAPRAAQGDFQATELFETAERRWRRIERKLEAARSEAGKRVNESRARNVDLIVEAIEETYYQIEKLLD